MIIVTGVMSFERMEQIQIFIGQAALLYKRFSSRKKSQEIYTVDRMVLTDWCWSLHDEDKGYILLPYNTEYRLRYTIQKVSQNQSNAD